MDRMKDYRQLIKELPSTTLVCALGDFDPPTTAHELLVKTVNRLAEQKNTDHVIYASTKDSLIQEDKKEQYLKLMFPKTKFKSVNESKISNLLEELSKKYKKIVIVAGSEQVAGLKKLVKENTQIIAINEKNPDSNYTKMKQLATKGLYEEFKKKLPSTIRELDGRRLMNDVRVGLGLEPVKEQLVLVKDKLREQYFRGEIFNEGDIVESNGEQFTIVKRGSNHLLLKEESGKLVSKWIQDVKPMEDKVMNEGVIQQNGSDKLDVSTSDTGAKAEPKPTGKVKGFITFYNFDAKDSVKEQTDPVAKERMKAQLSIKHAKEKESLAAKHAQENENIQTEETLDELSTDLLARYKTASAASAKAADASGNYAKGDKRFKGINKATSKQFDNDLKKHGQYQEELEEAKKKAVCPDCGKHVCECGEERPGIGTDSTMSKDPFFKEDFTDQEIDEMVNSVTDEDIENLYEEDELVLVYDDDGEEIPPLQEESKYDLMEVLSRTERMKGKIRLRKTSAKRGRSTKIALKRFSPPATINKRARRLAIKLMKKRMLRGRDYSKVSVGEKERIEKTLANRKDVISRIAQKLVSRVRKVEKSRMSHGKVTKGNMPSVF
jgi:phosphopantetheine adenylyltransferase